jgi:predicted kinase
VGQGELDGLIYDATNARRRHRLEAIAAAREVGFTTISLVWFDLPLSVALERNQGRSRQVPPDIIAAMARQIQGAPPSLAEGVDQILRPG